MAEGIDRRRVESQVDVFRRTLRNYAKRPPNDDRYFQTLDRAAYIETDHGGVLRDNIVQMFAERLDTIREISPQVAVNHFNRAVHHEALERLGPDVYPSRFGPMSAETIENFRQFLKEIAAVNNVSQHTYGDFQANLEVRSVQSNIPERAHGIKLLALLFPERFGERNFVEAGCSLNFLLKWMSNEELNSLARIEIVGGKKNEVDVEATRAVNAVLATRFAIGASLGVDIWDFYRDLSNEKWAIHCSVPPGEMAADPSRLPFIQSLAEYDPNNIHFLRADFADDLEMDDFPPRETYKRKIKPGESESRPFSVGLFDSAISSTVEYLLDDETRERFHAEKREMTKDDAINIEQDFARPVDGGLSFEEDIYAGRYLYRTMFFDKLNPDAGYQEAFVWETGRCRRARIGLGRVSIDGRLVSIRERLGLAEVS